MEGSIDPTAMKFPANIRKACKQSNRNKNNKCSSGKRNTHSTKDCDVNE